jgi:ferric enterobactin receptor
MGQKNFKGAKECIETCPVSPIAINNNCTPISPKKMPRKVIHLFMLSPKKSFLTGLILFLGCSMSTAQNVTIKGTVVDYQTHLPVEYASIALLYAKDSVVITGVLSKKNGTFAITKIDTGNYLLKIVFLGYELNYRNFSITRNSRQLDLDSIPLKTISEGLTDVIVTGRKAVMANKIDKQTYRSEQFESAKGGSAIDVLKNLPSIAVNSTGEISVRGSTGFLVLINGKPIVTDAQTILSQLPANSIENIELITAPSAKYDADGKAGIINILTKKGTTDGIGLTANIQAGLPATTDYHNLENPKRFGGDIMLTLKQKKWDLSVGGNYQRNDVNGHRDGDVYTKNFSNNTITRFPSSGERSFDKYNYAGRAAIVFTADKNNVLSVGFFAGKKFQARRADLVYNNSTADLTTNAILKQLVYFNSNLQTKEGNFTFGNFDYTHTFINKSTLTASLLYEHANLYGNTNNSNLNYPGKNVVFQQVYNPYTNPINGYRFKFDHSIVIGKGKLESGYQFRYDKQDGQFDYVVTPATTQADLAKFKGTAKSTNQVNSVYTQYAAKESKWEYVAGLRYEHAAREVNLSYDLNPHKLSLGNLFPSASILYSFNNSWNLKSGYSKRVQRNNNFELNPIPEREHSETLEQGDPDLLPQFVDLLELGINHNFTKGTFFATLYFQEIKNPIQRVNSVYADTILNRLFTNAGKAKQFGVEIGSNLKPVKWLTLFIGANVYNYAISGGLRISGVASTINNAGWVYSINANSGFDLGKKWALQASVNYLSKRPTAQGEDSRFFTPNLSLKKTFLNDRCSFGLQWQNINLGFMNANQQRITTSGKDFYTTTNYIYETDVLLLNFSFKINKLSSKTKLPTSEIGEKEF